MQNGTATVLSMAAQPGDPVLGQNVREQIQLLVQRDRFSQSQIAREAGITASVLSGWLKDRYQGDNQAVEVKLRQWLSAHSRKTETAMVLPETPGWLDTPTAQKIFNVLAYAQSFGDIAVVYGGAGLGKTCTLKQYAASNNNVWVASMSPAHGGVAAALEEISESLNLRGVPGRAARLQRELIRRLTGTSGLLIIDEAQHLNLNALEAIRALHDATGIGLALVGNESVYARLTGGSRAATFAQLFSRLGKRLRLNRPQKEDVEALATCFAVTGRQELDALQEVAQKPGALRGVVKTLRLATVIAAGENQSLALEHIRAAWRDLGGGQ